MCLWLWTDHRLRHRFAASPGWAVAPWSKTSGRSGNQQVFTVLAACILLVCGSDEQAMRNPRRVGYLAVFKRLRSSSGELVLACRHYHAAASRQRTATNPSELIVLPANSRNRGSCRTRMAPTSAGGTSAESYPG